MFPIVNRLGRIGEAFGAGTGPCRSGVLHGCFDDAFDQPLFSLMIPMRVLPPLTRSPTATVASVPAGNNTSTRDPNRISPTSSPLPTVSPDFLPENDPPGHDARNLREHDGDAPVAHHDDVALVVRARFVVERHKELSRTIVHGLDPSGDRTAIDVNVEERQENAHSGDVSYALQPYDLAVRGGHNRLGIGRNRSDSGSGRRMPQRQTVQTTKALQIVNSRQKPRGRESPMAPRNGMRHEQSFKKEDGNRSVGSRFPPISSFMWAGGSIRS